MMNDKNQNTSAPEVRRILPVMLKVENLHIHLDERSTSNTYFNGSYKENRDRWSDGGVPCQRSRAEAVSH